MTTTTEQPPQRADTPAPPRKRTPKPPRAPLVPTGRASPVVRVCARRPCGKERFYLLDEKQSALIITVQGYPTLTLDKVEALQALGVRFMELDDPEEIAERARNERRERDDLLARLAEIERNEQVEKSERERIANARAIKLAEVLKRFDTPPAPKPAHDLARPIIAELLAAFGVNVNGAEIIVSESPLDPLGVWHVIGRDWQTGETVGVTGLDPLERIANEGLTLLANSGEEYGGDFLAMATRGERRL